MPNETKMDIFLITLPWFVIVKWYGGTEEQKNPGSVSLQKTRRCPWNEGDHQCLYWTL